MNMKAIHFFTNLTNEDLVAESWLDTMCVDYFTTNEAINDPKVERVRTTQLSFLRNAWDYIDNGWRVFIHNGEQVLEVKEHMAGTDKDIRRGHDLSKLLIGGTFGEIY